VFFYPGEPLMKTMLGGICKRCLVLTKLNLVDLGYGSTLVFERLDEVKK
jgi:hypothetical protein